MEDTTQFNLRLSKNLIKDMDFIADNLNISRNDWLKVRIAELISKEKLSILEAYETRYVQGKMTNLDFKQKTGVEPTMAMKDLKKIGRAHV